MAAAAVATYTAGVAEVVEMDCNGTAGWVADC